MATPIHYLPAIQEYRFAKEFGEPLIGCAGTSKPQRITMNGEEINCATCSHYYWHVEGLELSPQAKAYVLLIASKTNSRRASRI